MMKKIGVLILFVLIFSSFVTAQTGSLPNQEEFENDSVVKGVQQIQDIAENRRWEYLSEKWKETLKKNKYFAAIDTFFTKINIVFVILFGQDYDFSLTLFVVFLMWIFFLGMFERIIGGFSTFGKGTSFVAALAMTVILAQLQVYQVMSVWVFKLIFFRSGFWRWILLGIFLVGYVIVLIYTRKIVWVIGRKFIKNQEKKAKWDEHFARKMFEKKVDAVGGALGNVGGALSDVGRGGGGTT